MDAPRRLVIAAFVLWSLLGIHRRAGPWGFLLIYALSFLSGGGVAQTLLVAVNAVLAFRARATLTRERQPAFGRLWKPLLAIAITAGLLAIYLGVVGYLPGVPDPDAVLGVCLASILSSRALFCLSFWTAGHDGETMPGES